MGGFAAKFRGFWGARGCGAAIQRTADIGGLTGRKIFLKRGEKPKNWGARVPEGCLGTPYIGCAGRFLGLEIQPLAALPEACFVQVSQLRAPQ